MLKKIDVKQLRDGMYVHELCGSWLYTPFWHKSFLLHGHSMLDKIVESGIQEAWIDTQKGVDVVAPASMQEAAQGPAAPSAPAAAVATSGKGSSLEEELHAASSIVAKSRDAVSSMFHEARMGRAIDAENAEPLVEEITQSVMRNPDALIGLARLKSKDDYTYMHSVAVCALMVALSRQLGLDTAQTREAGLAGLLHDIGKMAVPQDILSKPGILTDDEFVSIKAHPAAGHRILSEGKGVGAAALDVCLHHHEKIDGSGYPYGLLDHQISLYARMGAVCDVYDAITSNRPYKEGWCPAESLRKMSEWAGGKHFDEKVFQDFVKSIGIYPIGTLVRLDSGRLGVVVMQQPGKSLLTPQVRVFFSSKAMTYIMPELLDLGAPGQRDRIVAREEASAWGLHDLHKYWLGDVPVPIYP
jgi:putative nucleotidyltransferase with HDIG domain